MDYCWTTHIYIDSYIHIYSYCVEPQSFLPVDSVEVNQSPGQQLGSLSSYVDLLSVAATGPTLRKKFSSTLVRRVVIAGTPAVSLRFVIFPDGPVAFLSPFYRFSLSICFSSSLCTLGIWLFQAL